MKISWKSILYGTLIYLAFEAFTTLLWIAEVARPDLYLAYLQVNPWLVIGGTLGIAVMAVTVPWGEVL